MAFVNDSVTVDVEPWFIPIDIFEVICSTFAVLLALFFLFIIIFDKTCHTVPMLLVANSCLVELFLHVARLLWPYLHSEMISNKSITMMYSVSFMLVQYIRPL